MGAGCISCNGPPVAGCGRRPTRRSPPASRAARPVATPRQGAEATATGSAESAIQIAYVLSGDVDDRNLIIAADRRAVRVERRVELRKSHHVAASFTFERFV